MVRVLDRLGTGIHGGMAHARARDANGTGSGIRVGNVFNLVGEAQALHREKKREQNQSGCG